MRGGAIRRDMTERIYGKQTIASCQTGNPGRRFFFADVNHSLFFEVIISAIMWNEPAMINGYELSLTAKHRVMRR